jgi:hypothetical protein
VGHGTSPFSGGGFNIVKWMLGIMSIFFDIIFMLQHYVFYRNSHGPKGEEKAKFLPEDNVYYLMKNE